VPLAANKDTHMTENTESTLHGEHAATISNNTNEVAPYEITRDAVVAAQQLLKVAPYEFPQVDKVVEWSAAYPYMTSEEVQQWAN